MGVDREQRDGGLRGDRVLPDLSVWKTGDFWQESLPQTRHCRPEGEAGARETHAWCDWLLANY